MLGFKATIKNEAELEKVSTKMPDDFQRRLVNLVGLAGLEVADRARQKAPVRNNRLRASINSQLVRTGTRTAARVAPTVPYGPYVEYGTGLYGPRKQVIRPRKAKVLSWISRGRGVYAGGRYRAAAPGRRVFARFVRGMKPRPYLHPALDEVRPQFMADLRKLAELHWPKG